MKPKQPAGDLTTFLIDLCVTRISDSELQKRWRQGAYRGGDLAAMKGYLLLERNIS